MPLITEITIFVLAAFVGFEVISKVPTTLHTPLMSQTNAIHGIVLLGGLVALLALGGVAHKPWRVESAEQALCGKPAEEASFAIAADLLLDGAQPLQHNAFKPELARRAIIRALGEAAVAVDDHDLRARPREQDGGR